MARTRFENLRVYRLSEELADAVWEIVLHWLRRAYRRRLLSTEQVEELKTTLENLAPQLNAYLKSLVSRAK